MADDRMDLPMRLPHPWQFEEVIKLEATSSSVPQVSNRGVQSGNHPDETGS